MNSKRIRALNNRPEKKGAVIYWMSRDQRAEDNWALIYAQKISQKEKLPLIVVVNLVAEFLGATNRQYSFMLKGLMEAEQKLNELNIPLIVLTGKPEVKIPQFIKDINGGCLITDFDPLKIKREWKNIVTQKIDIPFYEVDAHNIVPAFAVTNKEEFAAYTIRPKILKLLPEFLEEFPYLKKVKSFSSEKYTQTDWLKIYKSLKTDLSVQETEWIKPGVNAAQNTLKNFIFGKIKNYSKDRNNPLLDAQSNLSAYLHFGQISAQRIALEVEKHVPDSESKSAFLEELIVRKELADNFCLFNNNYDRFEGFHQWAKKTLNDHRNDRREYIYSLEQFENADTHEDLWNAAQSELKVKGKMPGFMRMYWAKKILEWSESPEEALRIAIYLNDKYELDGRDPNGYAGCAWAIGGVHDRAWQERSVFGKIRYMNRSGCKRKFDVDEYVQSNE